MKQCFEFFERIAVQIGDYIGHKLHLNIYVPFNFPFKILESIFLWRKSRTQNCITRNKSNVKKVSSFTAAWTLKKSRMRHFNLSYDSLTYLDYRAAHSSAAPFSSVVRTHIKEKPSRFWPCHCFKEKRFSSFIDRPMPHILS